MFYIIYTYIYHIAFFFPIISDFYRNPVSKLINDLDSENEPCKNLCGDPDLDSDPVGLY